MEILMRKRRNFGRKSKLSWMKKQSPTVQDGINKMRRGGRTDKEYEAEGPSETRL